MRLVLPKRENIHVTGRTDPAHRHYHPLISYFMNKRLEGGLVLLGEERYDRILDIGYGGGIFLPELSTRCRKLYGIDIHDGIDKVKQMLAREAIGAELSYGDVTNIPFPARHFDGLVCISVLEFVKDLDRAFSEMSRVLKRNGVAVIGFPIENIFTDIAFFTIGINGRKAHPVNQDDILAAAGRIFDIEALLTFPRGLPLKLSLFAHARLRKRDG